MTLPPVTDPFYWTQESWGPALRCGALDDAAGHLFTTRQLELSSKDGWHRAAAAIGATRIATAAQVHSNGVALVRVGAKPFESTTQADVLLSGDPEVGVGVRVADCVPVLIADRRLRVVAAVHAGWRGTAASATRAAVEALRREFGCDPRDLVAAIGPSIGPCCYEVGSDVVDAFAAAGHSRELIDRWFLLPRVRGSSSPQPLSLDLRAANRDQLILAGVREDRIYLAGLCTAMEPGLLTSYRAEREKAGRLAAIIVPRRP